MSIYIEDKNGKRRKFAGVGSEKDYIDDGIASEKMTWSSEKILDTLCPEFSVSGNPVTCHPVEGYPLSAVVSLEPKQAGTGDPSPDNVRPISGWDEVTVTRCGKNLFGGGEENVWIGIGGKEEATQGAYSTGLIPCKEGDNFTLSTSGQFAAAPNNSDCICFYNQEYELLGRTPVPNGKSLTQTAPSGGSYVRASCYHVGSDNIQLELGSTPTPYEPYQGETSTLTLPETIYGGTVDAMTGVGSKTWSYIASYNGDSLPGEWISDRDVYSAGTTPTTGAQVAYKLATPEPFQATGNRPLSALPGTNTLYTDGNSLTVSGSTSPISAIESFKADVQASANQAEAVANILLGGA